MKVSVRRGDVLIGEWEGENAFMAGIAAMMAMHDSPVELLAALSLLPHFLGMGVRNFEYKVGSTLVRIEREG